MLFIFVAEFCSIIYTQDIWALLSTEMCFLVRIRLNVVTLLCVTCTYAVGMRGWWREGDLLSILWASQVGLVGRMHLPVQEMKQTQVQPLGREDPLEKEMATHSSVLAWTAHGQRSLVGYSPWGHRELDTTEIMSVLLCTLCKTWHLTCTVSLSWMLSLSLFYVKKPESERQAIYPSGEETNRISLSQDWTQVPLPLPCCADSAGRNSPLWSLRLSIGPRAGEPFPKSSKHFFFHISKQMCFKMNLSNRASWVREDMLPKQVWHRRHPSWWWPEICKSVESMYFSLRIEEYVLKSLKAILFNPKVVNLMNSLRPNEGSLCLMEDLKYWHVKYCSFLYILLCLEWPCKDGYQWIDK